MQVLGTSKNYPCPNGSCKEQLIWLYDLSEDMHYLYCRHCRLSITLDDDNKKEGILLVEEGGNPNGDED